MLIPQVLDVVKLSVATSQDSITILGTDDQFVIGSFNVSRGAASYQLLISGSYQGQGEANLIASTSNDLRDEGPRSRSMTCNFSLTMSTKRRVCEEDSWKGASPSPQSNLR